jgi:hypothetical protein
MNRMESQLRSLNKKVPTRSVPHHKPRYHLSPLKPPSRSNIDLQIHKLCLLHAKIEQRIAACCSHHHVCYRTKIATSRGPGMVKRQRRRARMVPSDVHRHPCGWPSCCTLMPPGLSQIEKCVCTLRGCQMSAWMCRLKRSLLGASLPKGRVIMSWCWRQMPHAAGT